MAAFAASPLVSKRHTPKFAIREDEPMGLQLCLGNTQQSSTATRFFLTAQKELLEGKGENPIPSQVHIEESFLSW